MRNHQENGNRYQFRLHPAAPAISTTAATTTATSATVATAAATATLAATAATTTITPNQLQQETNTNTTKNDENQQNSQNQQQQQQQHKNMSNITNNNNNKNNLNNIEKTKKSSVNAALLKCSLTTLPTVGGGHHGLLKDLNRKQFTPTSDASNASFSSASVAGSIQDDMSEQCSLTQAGLEEYNIRASSYYDQPVLFHHQKQSSYAQSEGYHSYVSSSDSSSATPFLDRLRQESDMLSRQSHHWSQNDLSSVASCNSVAPSPTPLILPIATVNNIGQDVVGNGSTASQPQKQQHQQQQQQQQHNNSSESTSSTETLKWLGSMSDVSEASHATGYSAISESVSSSQLIVHSSRVLTPKRHHSESVLYLNDEQQHSPTALQQLPSNLSNSALQYAHAQISPTLSAREYHSPTRPSSNHRHSPSYPPVHNSLTLHHLYKQPHQHAASIRDAARGSSSSTTTASDLPKSSSFLASSDSSAAQLETPASVASIDGDLQPQNHKSTISVTISSSDAVVTISPPQPMSVIAVKPLAASAAAVVCSEATTSSNGGASVIAIGDADSNTVTPQTATVPLSVVTTTTAAESCNSSSSSNSTASISPASSSAYRSNHRLFPVSTYAEPVHSNTSQYVHHPKPQYSAGLQKPVVVQQQQPQAQQQPPLTAVTPSTTQNPAIQTSPPQPSWQSVAELINDFERSTDPQPQQKFAFIEPSKTHRVSNPALKAFQKNAVQSYFERQQHQQQQQQHQQNHHHQQQQQQPQHSKDNNNPQKIYQPHPSHHHLQQMQQQQLLRPHSYQAVASAKEVSGQQLLRSSLPNTYGGSSTSQTSPQQLQQQQSNAMRPGPGIPSPQDDAYSAAHAFAISKPPSPAPPPPPPRSRSLMPSSTLLRRSSSASDYAEFRDQYMSASQEKLQSQSIKNISSAEKMSFNDCGMPPPPPPPRARTSLPPRRTSSASEFAAMRDKMLLQQAAALAHQQHHPQQHNQTAAALAASRAPHQYYTPPPPAAMIAASAIPDSSWVPERPPKNPNLRVPSPDLPPPPTADIDTSLSDEPLPPPPPEILHRQPTFYDGAPPQGAGGNGELLPPKAPSPNRRNSFAGSSTRRSFFSRTASTTSDAIQPPTPPPPTIAAKAQPPMIPKKPIGIELLQVSRPASSLAQQSNKAHKVLLNGSGFQHQQQQQYQQMQPPQLATKMNANRKRPHNPAVISIPPIMENATIGGSTHLKSPTLSSATTKSSLILHAQKSSPPPPLMPRMPNAASQGPGPGFVISSKLRCNSKASYLPRQSLEKLNNTDPDHGSYKLTLTSNEDLVANTKQQSSPAAYDILATTHQNGKLQSSNNLPDVLPLGAKLQPQPASPTSANGSPLRYGSNNNLNSTQSQSHQHQTSSSQSPQSCYPMYPPTQHRYSSPTMHSYGISGGGQNNSHYNMHHNVPSYTRSQSFDVNNTSAAGSPTKFMSQSSIDLKRTLNSGLETTLEEPLAETTNLLSPAQSENNLSSVTRGYTTSAQPSSPSRRELQRGDLGGQDRGSIREDSRIFRAELVNATLSSSPGGTPAVTAQKTVTRKDSLRENIEKITQLQSKLMSAHLSDTSVGGVLSGYVGKPLLSPTARAQTDCKLTYQRSDNNDEAPSKELNLSTCSCPAVNSCNTSETSTQAAEDDISSVTDEVSLEAPSLPKTPPPLPTSELLSMESDESMIISQISQMDVSTDGLKLMQRSEIVLRVNPVTAEVASQTDELPEMGDMCQGSNLLTAQHHQQHAKDEAAVQTSSHSSLQPRERHPIEIDCEQTAKELASLLTPNDKLIDIIIPLALKSPTDYVGRLYNANVPLRTANKRDVGTSTLMRMKRHDSQLASSADDRSEVTVELQYAELEMLLTNGDGEIDNCDLTMKKKVDELIKLLNRKIRILSREQTTVGEESAINDELGSSLIDKLADKVRPIEATKFRTYIDDVGHITSLLLSLSERLARAENALSTTTGAENNAEQKLLESKRDRLLEQLEEAKRLQEDIERRGASATLALEKHLSADEFADFEFFINMKAKLIADSRDIIEKIKYGEEQLSALSEMLIQSDC